MESVILALALLACPVGMGLMMWMMAKGNRSASRDAPAPRRIPVEELRAEQRRLAAEIERLEHGQADRVGGRS